MRKSKSRKRSRKSKRDKTIARKRAECRTKGLVYDTKTGKCRKSKRKTKAKNILLSAFKNIYHGSPKKKCRKTKKKNLKIEKKRV